jgi:hypothetical protein
MSFNLGVFIVTLQKIQKAPYTMPTTRRFLSTQVSLQMPPDTSPPNQCELPARAGSQSEALYQHVLNKQRRAARQLLFVELGGQRALVTFNLASKNNTLSCVGDVIMPTRSNSASRHALSAMYPGKKSVVRRSDAIPQVWMPYTGKYFSSEIARLRLYGLYLLSKNALGH